MIWAICMQEGTPRFNFSSAASHGYSTQVLYTMRPKSLWRQTVKFIYSEKATKFSEISTLLSSYVVPDK